VLTNTAPSLFGKTEAGFLVNILRRPYLFLCDLYCEPLVWFIIFDARWTNIISEEMKAQYKIREQRESSDVYIVLCVSITVMYLVFFIFRTK